MSNIGRHSEARSSTRKAKQELELQKALQEAEAKLINEKKYREAMMAEALRKLTPKLMKKLGITIIYHDPGPNATRLPPNYMRPTTASSMRPTTASSRRPTTASRHSHVAKGGRRTRKRRNGKKKTMRKGGRMRRHHSRNKR